MGFVQDHLSQLMKISCRLILSVRSVTATRDGVMLLSLAALVVAEKIDGHHRNPGSPSRAAFARDGVKAGKARGGRSAKGPTLGKTGVQSHDILYGMSLDIPYTPARA
jgi:hypothetical protein